LISPSTGSDLGFPGASTETVSGAMSAGVNRIVSHPDEESRRQSVARLMENGSASTISFLKLPGLCRSNSAEGADRDQSAFRITRVVSLGDGGSETDRMKEPACAPDPAVLFR